MLNQSRNTHLDCSHSALKKNCLMNKVFTNISIKWFFFLLKMHVRIRFDQMFCVLIRALDPNRFVHTSWWLSLSKLHFIGMISRKKEKTNHYPLFAFSLLFFLFLQNKKQQQVSSSKLIENCYFCCVKQVNKWNVSLWNIRFWIYPVESSKFTTREWLLAPFTMNYVLRI